MSKAVIAKAESRKLKAESRGGKAGGWRPEAPSGKRQAARRRHVTYCDRIPEGVLLYTRFQMAELLQVSLRCLGEMMQRGEVSYLKINGRMVRFRIEDVNRRLNETSLVWNEAGDWRREAAGDKGRMIEAK